MNGKDAIDQNFIRVKDITLVVTVIGLLAALWKYSGLNEIKEQLSQHTVAIAVIQSQYVEIKQDLDEIKRTNRAIRKQTE
jgi:hypothetical protein